MIFILLCRDKPGHLQTRLDNRADHLAHLEALQGQGRLHFAGPFLDADGKPCGSMVAIEAEDEEEARRMGGEDPYARPGLFETVEVRPWNWVFGKPEAA